MAATMVMPPRRYLGELSQNYVPIKRSKPINNVGLGKQAFSNSHFNVPSSTFDFSSKVKRSFDEYDNEDQENVDPVKTPAKKARGADGEAVKPRQPTIFNLTTVQGGKLSESAKIARKTLGVKSKDATKFSTAGAVGKNAKCPGIAARHRLGSKRVVRVEPHPANAGAPISINAALSGVSNVVAAKPEPQPSASTLALPSLNMAKANAARRAAKKLLGMGENGRQGHHFRIHEDTLDEEMAILMQHHTNTLDISDDEGRGKYSDDDNKENVPPPGVPASAVRRVARGDMMTEEVRSPLAYLEASLYYAPGCDASSVFNAPQEELPSPDLVDLEFGSLDGEVREVIKSKLNEVEYAVVESVAGNNAACNKSNII
ncbi:MAG: hypothetical protein Q9182_007266 [Xanthomendoza sp. 2 TL-2023]